MSLEEVRKPNILVIYHANCMDGLGALYAAVHKFGNRIEAHAATYGSQPPDVTNKDVYILDFSYPRETVIELQQKANTLFVIDHHATSEKALEGLPNTIFDKTKSGAVLAWEFFLPRQPVPEVLRYIQDRDLWKWDLICSREINEYLRSVTSNDLHNWSEKVDTLSSADISLNYREKKLTLIEFGAALIKTKVTRVKRLTEKPFYLTFALDDGLVKIPATFAESDIVSETGQALAELSEFKTGCIILPMGSNGKYGLSFRSIDDSSMALSLAESLGGGGHPKAAGCGISALTLSALIGDSTLM